MSTGLNETQFKTDIYNAVVKYGRQMTFYTNAGVSHSIWCTPPVRDNALTGQDGMVPQQRYNFLVPALNLTLDIYLMNRVVDGSVTYRITDIKPLDSGSGAAAYKLTVER